MTGHADLARRPAPHALAAEGPAQRSAIDAAPPVQALAETGRALNARPALVAQHALATRLSARAPVQRMMNEGPIDVPIDEHRVSAGPMTTTGLANCVALAGYNMETHDACLYHFNTDQGIDKHLKPPVIIPGFIHASRGVIDGALADHPPTHFQVVLGIIWSLPQFATTRAELIDALEAVFPGLVVHPGYHMTANWTWPELTGA